MKAVFRKSFKRDLKKIRDRSVLNQVRQTIEEIEAAPSLKAVSGIRKLSAAGRFYRIRIGEYRIGIAARTSEIEFVRCLHRREVYRYFP